MDEALGFGRRLARELRSVAGLGEVAVGCSDKEQVYAEDKLVLYRYRPRAAPAGLPPVVICYALVNRPYMVDLKEDRSLVRGLLDRGLLDALGNVPGEFLNATFLALMPFRLTSQKYVGLADIVDDPRQLENFMRMERWIFDSPDQAGEAFRQFVGWLFKENRLARGTLELGGRRVDLGAIGCPVLNVYATQDHLVPPSASLPLGALLGTRDYATYAFPGGHIGIYVSGRARQVPQAIADWLGERAAGRPSG